MNDAVSIDSPTEESSVRHPWAFVISLVVIAIDQGTKQWAHANLIGRPRSVIGDTLQLQIGYNEGSAFSLFGGGGFTMVLAVVAAIVSVVLVRMLRTSSDRWTTVGLALVLGGAIGNLTDRVVRPPGIFRGRVIDFISVRHIPFIDRWPIFNVADMAIVTGVSLLLIRSFKTEAHTNPSSE